MDNHLADEDIKSVSSLQTLLQPAHYTPGINPNESEPESPNGLVSKCKPKCTNRHLGREIVDQSEEKICPTKSKYWSVHFVYKHVPSLIVVQNVISSHHPQLEVRQRQLHHGTPQELPQWRAHQLDFTPTLPPHIPLLKTIHPFDNLRRSLHRYLPLRHHCPCSSIRLVYSSRYPRILSSELDRRASRCLWSRTSGVQSFRRVVRR